MRKVNFTQNIREGPTHIEKVSLSHFSRVCHVFRYVTSSKRYPFTAQKVSSYDLQEVHNKFLFPTSFLKKPILLLLSRIILDFYRVSSLSSTIIRTYSEVHMSKTESATKVLAFANHKGGVGKTTSAINVAYNLSRLKKRVLVVDCDPQGNASHTLGEVGPFEQEVTVADLFESDMTFSEAAVASKYDRVDLIPSNLNVYTAISRLGPDSIRRFFGLQRALDPAARETYDYIILDCPPTIEGTLLTNALVITDHVIIPVGAEDDYALSGVGHLVDVIKKIRKDAEGNTAVLGVLLTMFDSRTNACKIIREAALSMFGKQHVFKNVIPRNTTINQAVMAKNAVCDLDANCAGCKAYRALAREIDERIIAQQS